MVLSLAEYSAWRVFEPMVSSSDGVPLAVSTVTASVKVTVTWMTSPVS